MLPYICPDLGAAQRAALSGQVRGPLTYVNVALRNWRAWVRQGVQFINNPTGFYCVMKLDYPVSLGDYRFPTQPDEPMIVHMIHIPWPDGPRLQRTRQANPCGRWLPSTCATGGRFGRPDSICLSSSAYPVTGVLPEKAADRPAWGRRGA